MIPKLPAFIILNKKLNETKIIYPFTKVIFYFVFKFCYVIATCNNELNTKIQMKMFLYLEKLLTGYNHFTDQPVAWKAGFQ